MASPNTDIFSWNPVIEVSDEQYKLFHFIDRQLISTLIHTLGRDPFDSISVIAFLLWLERSRLGVKAVYKVNLDWPNHLIDMLADQVVALLEWLKNPNLVWEMRGDISMIQELCTPDVGFVLLHQRRLEILSEKTKIVNYMAEKAFNDMFPNGVVDRSVRDGVGHGSNGGGAVEVPREIENRSRGGFQGGSGSGGQFAAGLPDHGDAYVPRELVNRHHVGVQHGNAVGNVRGPQGVESNAGGEVAARIPIPAPGLRSYNHNGAGYEVRGRYFPDPRELSNMNRYVAGYGSPAFGPVPGRLIHDSRLVQNNNTGIGVPVPLVPLGIPMEVPNHIHNGVRFQTAPRIIYDPRRFNGINYNGLGYGIASRPVQVHGGPVHMIAAGAGGFGTAGRPVPVPREPEDMNGDGSPDDEDEPNLEDGQVLPNVPYGPRMGYGETAEGEPGTSQRSQMTRSRRAFSEDELAVLLRGLNVREEEPDVLDDDKTIFLTFSRGYPMTEPDIWGFFTRRFGNFIKSIHMEEVVEGAQPLYARMVARNSSILPLICDLDQTVRTKYVINGKHVWAKKYVRRRHTPPPRLSASTSAADPPPPPTPPPPPSP